MNKTLTEKIEEIIKDAYYQGTAEGNEYSCGVDESHIKAMVTLFQEAVEAERARLESLIPEKGTAGWNSDTDYDRGFRDGFDGCISIMQEAVKKDFLLDEEKGEL